MTDLTNGNRIISQKAEAESIEIETSRGVIPGVLHPVANAASAIIMVGGAGGGIFGPSRVYELLANRLQAEGITALRLEYRHPNDLPECIYDVLVGVELLSQQGVERVVLVGWSFGGAVVISAGAASEKVVGVATVASQTYGTGAVTQLAPRSLLLIHGTADDVLPPQLSQQLYDQAGEPKELVLYPGDNHGIDRHASEMQEKLYTWSRELLLES